MRRAWIRFGRVLYWVCLPGLWLYLLVPRRTRVLLMHNDRLLVVKTWLGDGRWSLPGGGLHHGEKPVDGVRRELLEETGVILPVRAFYEHSRRRYAAHGICFRYALFTAQAERQYELNLQRIEITDAAWLRPAELTRANAAPDVLVAVQIFTSAD